MSVTIEDGPLGKLITSRCGNQITAVSYEKEDGHWRIVVTSLPTLRVNNFDEALTWVTHLTTQGSGGTGDVVAVRGDDIYRLFESFLIRQDDFPSIIRIWIDPLDRAAKFKFGGGTWSPPLGQIEEETA